MTRPPFPTDDAAPAIVLDALDRAVQVWEPCDRVIGTIRAMDIVQAIAALREETLAWRACAQYDPDMSGRGRFKGWDRSALDRCRAAYIDGAAPS